MDAPVPGMSADAASGEVEYTTGSPFDVLGASPLAAGSVSRGGCAAAVTTPDATGEAGGRADRSSCDVAATVVATTAVSATPSSPKLRLQLQARQARTSGAANAAAPKDRWTDTSVSTCCLGGLSISPSGV